MNKRELVIKAFGFADFEAVKSLFSDDFQFTDGSGGPALDKAAWFGMGATLIAAFPDMEEIFDEVKEDGEQLIVRDHWVGTFTNPLDLSAAGAGVIPPSGKKVVFPDSTVRVSFKGDQISSVDIINPGPDSGLAGIFKALGVSLTQ
jgi:hypothetical protein